MPSPVPSLASAPAAHAPTVPAWEHVPRARANDEPFALSRLSGAERRAGMVTDASGVVRATPARVVMPASTDELRTAIAGAARDGLQVTTAGTRHSGGGQSMQTGAVLLDMRAMDGMRYDAATSTLLVQPGATWDQVKRYLDPLGRSIPVQQSSDVFSVGGSVATNIHGRDVRFGPLVDAVEGVKVMLADGREVDASPTANADLFALVNGGYGQAGVITEVRLATVPNEQLQRHVERVPRAQVAQFMQQYASAPDARLLQVRLPVTRRGMFGDGYAIEFDHVDGSPAPMKQPHAEPIKDAVARAAFRSGIHCELGKVATWEIQKHLAAINGPAAGSRNQVMAPSAEFLRSGSHEHRQVLQEYFVPPTGLDGFLDQLRDTVVSTDANLLNVTLRWLPRQQTETALPYATQDSIAAVLYLDQRTGPEAQAHMDDFTRAATDAAVAAGGSMYLPYQLGAFTPAQLAATYPNLATVAASLRKWDPDNRFTGAIEHIEHR